MTTLRDRAATALDLTHDKEMSGFYTKQFRAYAAAWLDGKKMKTSFVRKVIKYLEARGR